MIKKITVALSALSVVTILSSLFFWGSAYLISYDIKILDHTKDDPVIITDRNRKILRSIHSKNSNRRASWVELGNISPYVISTLIASEDKNFYSHFGIDATAVLRAIFLDIKALRFKYGASTITMQLIRMVHSKGKHRSLYNKIKESILAVRLERILSKNKILEQYLNRADFGHGAVGIEDAAFTYLKKTADSLTLGEAVFLMVLPRGSSFYNPVRHYKRVIKRRNHLLYLLKKKRIITAEQMKIAKDTKIKISINRHPFYAFQFVNRVYAILPDSQKKNEAIVITTLDLSLQKQLERRTRQHVEKLKSKGVMQAGVVVLDTKNGDILAMVGSTGRKSNKGNINITTTRRYPGSALKPFVYATAIENGDTPYSITLDKADVPSVYKVKRRLKERGAVRYREALAGSYNIAAVHVLEKTGIEKVINRLKQAWVSPLLLPKEKYGLRLALGSTKTTLVDLASAYGFIVREGKVIKNGVILKVEHKNADIWIPPLRKERQIFSKETSWLIMNMLSDANARHKVFGYELPSDLPYKIVAKSGTARGFSDVVAIFATKEYISAAWTGRFDGRPTHGVLGLEGAGPLARAGLLLASKGRRLTLPSMPHNIESIKICPKTGQVATGQCTDTITDYHKKQVSLKL